MGLIVKPPSWSNCTTNMTGTPAVSLSGIIGSTVVAGSSNIDGAVTTVLTNLPHDVEYLVLAPRNFTVSAGNGSVMLDIMIDPAGGTSWQPFIDDLLVGETQLTAAFAFYYHFPIWLKSGHSVGARAKTAHTSDITTGQLVVAAYGGNANPGSWWCGQTVTGIGTSSTLSRGVNHTAGNSGVYSAWTSFGDPLPSNAGAVQFIVQGTNTDTTQSANGYFFEFGIGGTRIGPNYSKMTTVAESGALLGQGPIFCGLPSGAQFQVRGTCSSNAEILDVAAYVVS
jgi:hypothetical protein